MSALKVGVIRLGRAAGKVSKSATKLKNKEARKNAADFVKLVQMASLFLEVLQKILLIQCLQTPYDCVSLLVYASIVVRDSVPWATGATYAVAPPPGI